MAKEKTKRVTVKDSTAEVTETKTIDKKALIAKYLKKMKKEHGEDVSLGIAADMNLGYDFLVPPIMPLATLMAPDGQAEGGFPTGKFSVLAGAEKSGKTTICLQTLAADQAKHPDDFYAWVDTEHSFDKPYAELLGVDFDRLIMIRHGVMHDVLNRIIELSKMGVLRAVFIDSVGGLTPKEELESSKGEEHGLEKDHMLNLQRKLGQFFRMISPFVARTGCAVVMIAHVYQDPGMQGAYRVKGGNALKHWGHVRLMVSRVNDQATKQKIIMPDGESKDVFTGHDVITRLDKTRQNSKEGQSVKIPYRYGIGLDSTESSIAVAINLGIIERAGAWYTAGEKRLQGRKNVVSYYSEDPKAYSQLLNDIITHYETNKETKIEEKELDHESIA